MGAKKKAEKYEESYDIIIYKGVTEFLLNDLNKSIFTLQYSLLLVKKEQKLNDDEKKYLKYYILNILLKIFNIKKEFHNIEKYEFIFKNIQFERNNVRKRLKEWFPSKL